MSADDGNRPLGEGVKPDLEAIDRYLVGLAERRTLGAHEERALVTAAQAGDARARQAVVELFLPAIAAVARMYRSSTVERLELLQEGVVGLLRALERYDAARGTPFWGYAVWWVRQAMQQLVAELTRPVVLSDRALRGLARLRQAHEEHVQAHGREPSRAELAQRARLSADQVDDLLALDRPARSLDEPIADAGDPGISFGELLDDPLAEDAYDRVLEDAESIDLQRLLAGLSDREREVLRCRYGLSGEERSLRELGEALGLSGERVRQIERRALAKLAARAGA